MVSDRPSDHDDQLQGGLDEFLWDLFWTDDLGLWELAQMTAGRTGENTVDLVPWARQTLAALVDAGVVRTFVTSWPGMKRERPLEPTDLELLTRDDAPWYDPVNAALLVIVEGVGKPPIAPEDRPWRFDGERP